MTARDAIDPLLSGSLTQVRGTLKADMPLDGLTWFRVGGPARFLFQPADEEDLRFFLTHLDPSVDVTVIGLGSNLLVRDGGLEGVVIRLSGRGFGAVTQDDNWQLRVGAAVPDMRFAKIAAEMGIGGFAFYRGIPGGIGGALKMNAGAHGGQTADRLVSVRAVDRQGNLRVLDKAQMGFSYRHSSAPGDLIFVEALYLGRPGDTATLVQEMAEVTAYREEHQPTRERTGGSTFKNPEGHSAWELIDAAGCRGLQIGGARVSDKHCNFLINQGEATALDLETLGETVRARVLENSGVRLEWEIRRLGNWCDGLKVEEFLGADR